MRLRRQITCGRCLVQNGQSRPRQQQPRKGQALLLPLREDGGPVTRRVQGRVPRDIGCEAVQDAPQIDTLEHGLQFGIGGGRSGGRARGGRRGLCGGRGFGGRSSGGLGPRGIQQLFAECAQDHVGLLGDEKQVVVLVHGVRHGATDLALARAPEARKSAQKGRLPAAGGSHQEDGLAGLHPQVQPLHKFGLGVGSAEEEVGGPQQDIIRDGVGDGDPLTVCVGQHCIMPLFRISCRRLFVAVGSQNLRELPQPIDYSCKPGDCTELRHDQRHVTQDVVERRGALVDDPELHLPFEVQGRNHSGRKQPN
mmetsp:Transcript_52241/g.87115  ORF Transcript_52241/g.87115 Transcript_52241/m.87115 type:complete len:309 (+) Transcript_52241:969-1895(+)